ncbi:hypothetical protein INS49_015574 [Diaporthe citri]|uniref:uncharacterized protein n=1 Tax=Diaporthe citri TaxID=83186 RepID=UPI001C7F554C|nr:uncharacterized protein INS49_015574 [Diaporthe citri]KAG6356187.1 hypothetical protein INS49_015574 [Diaporthe citri]
MSNDEDTAQSGENAEWMNDWFDFEAAVDPNYDQAQQDQDTSPPAQPSVEGFENSQVQQGQNNAESTNFLSLENVQDQQARNPPGNIDQGGTFPIPSVIDLIKDQKECIFSSSNTPSQDLLLLDAKVRRQIQLGQNSPNNSNPGERRPIPSIIGMDRGRSDGPRTEAKDLRAQIRTRGLDVFSEPQWEPIMQSTGSGWQFRHHVGRGMETFTTIRRGNRKGFNEVLRQDGYRKAKRLTMIVQQDGGEVLVEGIICENERKCSRTPTSTLLEIFEGFEV